MAHLADPVACINVPHSTAQCSYKSGCDDDDDDDVTCLVDGYEDETEPRLSKIEVALRALQRCRSQSLSGSGGTP